MADAGVSLRSGIGSGKPHAVNSAHHRRGRTLPLCIAPGTHHFTIPPAQKDAVCTRCGLIREQPKPKLRPEGWANDTY